MRKGGFTLMELLVVVLIIGVLSTVAIRTIDATRDRGLFDQTAREMRELIYAMVGNPELIANGQRVDFGFFGDMMRLPNDLRELAENTTNSPQWRGPYLRREFLQDTIGYRLDAWGNPYTYDPVTGTIATLGNGKYPMTMRVCDSVTHLTNNIIIGNISDAENNPPGERAATVGVKLILPNGQFYFTRPDNGGFYMFSPETHGPIPIGLHKIVAYRPGGDSIVRMVTVVPRSKTVVDFKFTRSFRNYLQLVGEPILHGDSAGFSFQVVNPGGAEDTIHSITFLVAPESAYARFFRISGNSVKEDSLYPGRGQGDSIVISPPYVIQSEGREIVMISLFNFRKTATGDVLANVYNKTFRFKFSDGSEIAVTPVRQ